MAYLISQVLPAGAFLIFFDDYTILPMLAKWQLLQ
nr:MAG TPA: hypothetical protein [Caudoviricetes sp.]